LDLALLIEKLLLYLLEQTAVVKQLALDVPKLFQGNYGRH